MWFINNLTEDNLHVTALQSVFCSATQACFSVAAVVSGDFLVGYFLDFFLPHGCTHDVGEFVCQVLRHHGVKLYQNWLILNHIWSTIQCTCRGILPNINSISLSLVQVNPRVIVTCTKCHTYKMASWLQHFLQCDLGINTTHWTVANWF